VFASHHSEVNVPVYLHSDIQKAASTINSGDYTIADLDGVVCCPKELVEKVLDVVPGIAAAVEKCADAVKGGMSVEEAFTTFRGR
jgi:regulator of RNase E activity RraA